MVDEQPENVAGDVEHALERFVVENDDLLILESLIGRFNIFDALGIARAEIRHSNFLAFILDPGESHGQGQLFLKAILIDILKSTKSRPFSPIELDGADLRAVQVRREWEHIDLLITCEQPAFVMAIENKVDSKEHSQQLSRYQSVIDHHFHNVPPLFVFLSPNADEPSEDAWIPYSYEDIHRVLLRVRGTYQNSIGDDVLVFLDHYLSLIGTRFMNDVRLDELCRRIYKNHRQAIDLIVARVGMAGATVLTEAGVVLADDSRWHVFDTTSKRIDFIPAAWLQWLPALVLDNRAEPQSWLVLRFYLSDDKLDFYTEVRRIEDLQRRRQIIEFLSNEICKAGLKKTADGKVTDKYTRVSDRKRVLSWSADKEPLPDATRSAVKAELDLLYGKIESIADAVKSYFDSVGAT